MEELSGLYAVAIHHKCISSPYPIPSGKQLQNLGFKNWKILSSIKNLLRSYWPCSVADFHKQIYERFIKFKIEKTILSNFLDLLQLEKNIACNRILAQAQPSLNVLPGIALNNSAIVDPGGCCQKNNQPVL